MTLYSFSSLARLESASRALQRAKDHKTDIIDQIMSDITPVCIAFESLWKEKEPLVHQTLKALADHHSCELSHSQQHPLNADKLVYQLARQFPIYNVVGDVISDNLPRTNDQWKITDRCDATHVILEIDPLDLYTRFPTDPENNPYSFTYKVPQALHSSLMQVMEPKPSAQAEKTNHKNDDNKNTAAQSIKMLIEPYINTMIDIWLDETKEKMLNLQRQKSIQVVEALDFSDPVVMEAVRKKLKLT